MKTINYRLKKKLDEVYFLEPNDLGLKKLTYLYKGITRYLKTAPFIIVIPLAFLISILLYFIFGYLLVRLTSILQYGF